MYWFNNTVNIWARNAGLYSIISSPLGYLQILFYSTCDGSFLHLTWALSTCNQQEGFLTQSTRATCQFVICRRGCRFCKLDSPEWTFILLLWKYLAAFPAPATWILWLLNCVWILPRTNSLANSPLLSFVSSCRPSLIPQFICHGSPLHDPVSRNHSPVLDAISSPQPSLPQIPSPLWFSWLNKDCYK